MQDRERLIAYANWIYYKCVTEFEDGINIMWIRSDSVVGALNEFCKLKKYFL